MPLVRIDMHADMAHRRRELSEAIHEGLVEGLPMPKDDLFQIFRLHEPGDLIYTASFSTAERSDIIFIQILLADIYEANDKQRMYERVVGNIAALGVKPDNVLIAVTENSGPDWCAPSKDLAPRSEDGHT